MPVVPPGTDNSAAGLVLLDGDHKVVVTGEEHHQRALALYSPRADGRPRPVAAELVPVAGPGARPGIEVRIDGWRVGELTAAMALRYGPYVADVVRRGGRPGCLGRVERDRRGLQVVLRLPDVRRFPVPIPVPPQRAPSDGLPPVPVPVPAPPRRPRTRYWVGAGVAGLLVVLIATSGGNDAVEPTPSALGSSASTTTAAATTTADPAEVAAAPAAVPPALAPTSARTPAPAAPPARPTTRASQARAAAPTTAPPTKPSAQKQAAPRTTTAEKATTKAKAAGSAGEGCHANYSGCVPIAGDVDCEGGSGNGPAYVRGPVGVKGADVYGLDSDDDGVACE